MKMPSILSSYWKPAIVVLALAVLRQSAHAQCANVQAVYQTASANAQKCGFAELCCASTPPKYYLQSQDIVTDYGGGDEDYAWAGTLTMFIPTGNYDTTTTTTYNYLSCATQVTYSGTCTYQEIDDFIEAPGPPDPSPATINYSATRNSTGTWIETDGGYAIEYADDIIDPDEYGYSGWLTGEECTSGATTNSVSLTSQTLCTAGFGAYGEGSWSSKQTETTILTSEFTDPMLRGKMMSLIPATFGGWMNATGAFASAFYSLDINHFNASGLRSQYYFHITDCQPHTSYIILWDEVTTYADGGQPPLVKHLSEEVESNGDPVAGTDSSMHTAEVPVSPSVVTEENIRVTYAPWDNFGS
jgi:hypothetical protein